MSSFGSSDMYSFLCFKQKTAYEMRISDWSSDVCSSDLARLLYQAPPALLTHQVHRTVFDFAENACDIFPQHAHGYKLHAGKEQNDSDQGGPALHRIAIHKIGHDNEQAICKRQQGQADAHQAEHAQGPGDRKSTRLNSS